MKNMIKFYFKILNRMLVKNLFCIVIFLLLIFNTIIRIFKEKFIHIPAINNSTMVINLIPNKLYSFCDLYLLLLFVILIFFFLGIDFKNSMEDLALSIGGSRTNKFMLRKLTIILLLYFALYFVSFVNIYTLYLTMLPGKILLTPLKEIIFYSMVTNIFIISLSLFILFLSRDAAVSTSIITAYYLIEEGLWRCKVTQKYGILGHIYQYNDYENGEILKIKLFYLLLSLILIFLTYKISKRKHVLKFG